MATFILNSTMEKVKLIFPSLNDLWEFIQVANTSSCTISVETKYLECNCSQHDLEQAINTYKAKVVPTDAEEQKLPSRYSVNKILSKLLWS